ncbi:MAG: ASKHA domain-containing protein [Gracilibacteraceae bacterium]|jgi:uncharacterized 2Fe-2S/4Fe-4S cluster protein (DUF4445 family)|nr:ASKHA domain-containing protein [Gracilibacteraceae bacterium]
MSLYRITFEPDGAEVRAAAGETLLQAAAAGGILLDGPCGGRGTCGKCRLYLRGGDGEEKPVLACRTPVTGDMTVRTPLPATVLTGKGRLHSPLPPVVPDPGIRKTRLTVGKPDICSQAADLTRFYAALGRELPLTLRALTSLPEALRAADHRVTAVYTETKVLAVEPGDTTDAFYGVAVDIGTTTIAATLVDLRDGSAIGTASATNAQNIFGADVISRIEHSLRHPQGLERLRRRVLLVLNDMIARLCQDRGLTADHIYRVTVAGNTAMEHLFLGISPRWLAAAPFAPPVTHPVSLTAAEAGLNIYAYAEVRLISNIAGYVGGDTTAAVLAAGISRKSGVYLLLDVGTNGEIVLAADGSLSACSTAAGPAFEGAHIRCGMRAAPGAVDHVGWNDESADIAVHTIDGAAPAGICGSGLLQAVRVMLELGVVEPDGRMAEPEGAEAALLPPAVRRRLTRVDGDRCFILADGERADSAVAVTQKDVRELQLAKSAIRSGIETLLREAGLTAVDIDEVLLAGAFGNYLDPGGALALGMLPPLAPERIRAIGNAAGTGALMALISEDIFWGSARIAGRVKHLELSTHKDFQDMFIDNLSFPG